MAPAKSGQDAQPAAAGGGAPAARGTGLPAPWPIIADPGHLPDQDKLLEFLAAILAAPTGFSLFATDPDGTILLWSGGSASTYGYQAREVLGRLTLADLSGPAGQEPGSRAVLNETLKGGIWQGTGTQVRKDGHPFTARILVSPVRHQPGGGLLGFLVASRDISAEAGDIATLQTGLSHARRVLDQAPVPILTVDDAGVIREVNQALLDLSGRSRDRLAGTRLEECFRGSSREHVQDLLVRLPRKGAVTGLRLATAWQDGQEVACSAVLLRDQDDYPQGAVVTLADLADRRDLERELRQAQALRQAIAESADGTVTLTADGVITDVSDGLCELLGYTRDELTGSPLAARVSEHGQADGLLARLRSEPWLLDWQLPVTAGDGTVRWLALNAWTANGQDTGERRLFAAARDVTAAVAEREKAGRESAYARGLIEASADGLAVVGLQGRISDLNGSMCELLRCSREEVLGAEFSRCFHDPGAATGMLSEALLAGKAASYELHLAARPEATVSVSASVFRDAPGNVAGVFCSARDISAQARLRREISAREAYNRALIESPAEAFIAISPEGVITDANALAAALTGYPRERLPGREFPDLFDDPEQARRVVAEAFRQGRVAGSELVLTAGGRRRTIGFSAGVFRDPEGEPSGLLAAVRDISGQKEAETRLRELQFYTRSLIEANQDAMLVMDGAGRITDANRQAEIMTGQPRDVLIGSHAGDYVTEPGRIMQLVPQVERDGRFEDVELTVRRPDGSTLVVSCNGSTYTDSHGEYSGVLASARDITEWKRTDRAREHMLAEARRLDEARSDFVSRVSHELRSPLTGVLGYVELLQLGRAGELTAEQRRVMDIVERNGKRLLAQIEDLLLLSRIEAGTLQFALEPVRLAPLIGEIEEGFRPAIGAKRIECHLDVDPGLAVESDPAHLERLVSNLVSNAVKFTQDGGHVGITAHRDGETAVIRVSDDGIGIPADEQSRIFSRFFRSSLSAEREIRGTGLGLFIVKNVAESLGGSVTAESAPDAGSTFTVRLPLRQPQPRQEEATL